MTLISVEDITVQVGSRRTFEHTTWVIEKHQNWAILGETGSGKTTLAMALCRKLPLVQGQIHYFFDNGPELQSRTYLKPGEILTLSAETHQDFMRPYTEYHQARWQSFEGEEVPRVADLFDADDDPDRRAEILRLLNLEPLLERKILHLSHGESRKVLIARLWLKAPRLLILDDPYVGLDTESRAHLAQAIEALIRRGEPQLLLVTARVEEIPAGIHQLVVVRDSRVAVLGERQVVTGALPSARTLQTSGFQHTASFAEMAAHYSRALALDPALRAPELVRMEQVSIRYGEVQVLRNVTWSVRQGERWALLGHNGAGKTTLLSLILGDNPQSYANEIYLFGRRRGSGESIWEIKRRIGWVSPEQQIYYPRSASFKDVVCSGFFDSSGLYRQPAPEQAALAGGWIRAFGMEAEAELPFQRLSAGQQRLALLARALVKSPPLLILDEPCQGLDEDHRRYFVDLLDQLCTHAPVTLIYVAHLAEEIPRCVTHHLRLERGERI